MKRPVTKCVIVTFCDQCGRECNVGATLTIDGVVYCGRRECSSKGHKLLKQHRAKTEIAEQPFFLPNPQRSNT